jgi:hypothetical protein
MLAIGQFAIPRVVRPAGAVAHRKDVDIAVQREVTAAFPGLEPSPRG